MAHATDKRRRKPKGKLQQRGKQLVWGERTYIMGVINVTPDSFSGDGLRAADAAVKHGMELYAAGADILDVGGESTRPGYEPISAEEELSRILPVISRLREQTDALISVDTLKPEVFAAARAGGADILNTVAIDPRALIRCAAESAVPIVLTHNQEGTTYSGDVVNAVVERLTEFARQARDAGIADERILVDPGIGFGKTADHNLQILHQLHQLCALPHPVLMGTSRKSTLGKLTGRPADRREFATAATVALAIAAGADVVRVHNVEDLRDVVITSDAIVRGWRPRGW